MNDYDPPACFQERQRKARKPHRCCECDTTIEAGQVYLYSSGVWDGHPDDFKTCLPCADVRKYCTDGYLFQGLHEQIWDMICDGWRPPEGATVPEWVREMIERESGDAPIP